MQRERAVVSITLRPCSIACRWVNSGISFASGSVRGSPSSTPSTPFFAIRIASAPISSARSAAAVSVVKNGLPVPAAKMTIRSFSRCRIARRRMYGSAISAISIADWARVAAPRRPTASWGVRAAADVHHRTDLVRRRMDVGGDGRAVDGDEARGAGDRDVLVQLRDELDALVLEPLRRLDALGVHDLEHLPGEGLELGVPCHLLA